MSNINKKSFYNQMGLDIDGNFTEGKVEYSNSTGLQKNLSSTERTANLQKIAKERGERLRTIREQAKKTLEEFAQALNMNAGHIARLERGESCLSLLFAAWITKIVINYGIIVTNTWLLSGKGTPPQFIINEPLNLYNYVKDFLESRIDLAEIAAKDNTEIEKHKLIMDYMMIFLYKQANPECIITYVRDTKMEPSFFKGNIVAGKKVNQENHSEINGKDCIVFHNNQMIVRTVIVAENNYVLCAKEPKDVIVLEKLEEVAVINFRMFSEVSEDVNIKVIDYNNFENIVFDVIKN